MANIRTRWQATGIYKLKLLKNHTVISTRLTPTPDRRAVCVADGGLTRTFSETRLLHPDNIGVRNDRIRNLFK